MTELASKQLDTVDIHTIERYHENGYPWAEWTLLREHAPVYWYERDGIEPFWAITRYDDVKKISLDETGFINGGPRLRLASEDYDMRRLRARKKRIAQRGWDPQTTEDLVYLDNPEHRTLRLITARRFTSAYCRTMAANLETLAQQIVAEFDTALARGQTVDLVEGLSVKLPLATICHMMGLPQHDWHDIHRWTDALLDLDSLRWARAGESRYEMRKRLHTEFHDYLCELIERKRAQPSDDLSSMLVDATMDGRALTDQELHGYLRLLITAGNETTRNAATRGAKLLMDHPDQCALLEAEPQRCVNTLVEEIIRYTSPVIQFARTATRDVTMHGQNIRSGDTVGIWYPAANRDPRAFSSPEQFDMCRTPNQHLGFGRGAHFCLGANLARFELRALFLELGRKGLLSQLERSGAPRRLTDLHVGAIAEMPVRRGHDLA